MTLAALLAEIDWVKLTCAAVSKVPRSARRSLARDGHHRDELISDRSVGRIGGKALLLGVVDGHPAGLIDEVRLAGVRVLGDLLLALRLGGTATALVAVAIEASDDATILGTATGEVAREVHAPGDIVDRRIRAEDRLPLRVARRAERARCTRKVLSANDHAVGAIRIEEARIRELGDLRIRA